jgi:hypothetical protein
MRSIRERWKGAACCLGALAFRCGRCAKFFSKIYHMKIPRECVLGLCIGLMGFNAAAAPRVALMDFSTDDNSYLSAQAAANITGLVQVYLLGELKAFAQELQNR